MSARRSAQAAAWLAGVLTMIEVLLLCRGGEAWLVFITIFPPIVACGFLVGPLVRRQWRRFAALMGLGLGLHTFVGFIVAMGLGGGRWEIVPIVLLIVAMLFGLTAIAAMPVLVAGVVLGARRDHEAGDAMLAWAGAWLVGLQTLALVWLNDSGVEHTTAPVLVMLAGLAVGLLACGTYVGRAIARRAWCSRVARGELEGWRVRENTSPDELAALPPMFGSPREVAGVLERVEMGGVLYRSGLIGTAVAAVRVSP